MSIATTTTQPSPLSDAATDSRVTGRIVAIDDDPMTLRLLSAHLGEAGHQIETASNGTTGLELLDESTAVALVDLRMPDISGFDVLRFIQQHHPAIHVIILTGSEETADAVQAMRDGAFQFITKPFAPDKLIVFIEKALESWHLAEENRNLRASHSHSVPVRDIDVSGDMHARLMQQVDKVASLDATVFIGGETGTGKSTIARLIHQKSKRSDAPFVSVNCASLPRDLIQSELFGHTKGAFTGATSDRIGLAEVADGGTLFLDEIGDLPIDLQPKLLTFLQDRTVQRVGSTKSKTVNVRLIAATHRDLAEMCRAGHFRQDLYFRLLVLNLELPALRYRLGEFTDIVESILKTICTRNSIPVKRLSGDAIAKLMSHDWPGNIRELENVLERAVAYSPDEVINCSDLLFNDVSIRPDLVDNQPKAIQQVVTQQAITEANKLAPAFNNDYQLAGKTLEQIERDAIIETLKSLNGNKAKSARTLGISEKSIYNKMRRLQIKPDEFM